MSFLSNMAVTQATVLLHLPYSLQILPWQPLLQNASQDPTADCRDKALSYPFNLMERQKKWEESMAGVGETGKQRNVENGISPCRCSKKVRLSLPHRPALQKTCHIYEQGWNGQAKGSDATEQKPSATHTWYGMILFIWLAAVTKKKERFLSQQAQRLSLCIWQVTWTGSQEQKRWKQLILVVSIFSCQVHLFLPPGPTQLAGGLSASSHRNCVAQRSQWHCATRQ